MTNGIINFNARLDNNVYVALLRNQKPASFSFTKVACNETSVTKSIKYWLRNVKLKRLTSAEGTVFF